jgi:hypothetical protein
MRHIGPSRCQVEVCAATSPYRSGEATEPASVEAVLGQRTAIVAARLRAMASHDGGAS